MKIILSILWLFFAVISCESITKKLEEVTESGYQNNSKFPIEGTWYVNDNGETSIDNALNFSEFTFGSPTKVADKLIGKFSAVHFQDINSVYTGDYEIVGANILVLSLPNEMDYEFTYTYYPDEQKLEITYAGQNKILTREKPGIQTSQADIKVENENNNTQL